LLKWYVDGSHNEQLHCKGCGSVFRLGQGAMSSYSRKVRLNTQSSMETELKIADMYMQKNVVFTRWS
jgi:hypothetical protein